jgi:hypothetical protein
LRRAHGRPGQLLKVEGVSPALLVKQSGAGHVEPLAQQLPGLIQGQSAEVDPGHRRAAVRSLQCDGQTFRGLPGAERHRGEHGRGGLPAQQRAEHLDRCRVCPVEVVKDEDDRQAVREVLEQRPHCTVAAVALVLGRHLLAVGQRRQ